MKKINENLKKLVLQMKQLLLIVNGVIVRKINIIVKSDDDSCAEYYCDLLDSALIEACGNVKHYHVEWCHNLIEKVYRNFYFSDVPKISRFVSWPLVRNKLKLKNCINCEYDNLIDGEGNYIDIRLKIVKFNNTLA